MEQQIFSSVLEHWDTLSRGQSRPSGLVFLKLQSKLASNGCVVMLILDADRQIPVAIVKIPRNPAFTAHIEAESQAIDFLTSNNFSEKVLKAVPGGSIVVDLPSQRVLLQSVCSGEPMVKQLISEERARKILPAALAWLNAFQKEGAEDAVLDGDVLKALVTDPIRQVREGLPEAYAGLSEAARSWFDALPDRVRGRSLKLTPHHGDFNVHNLLISETVPDSLYVIDWEDFARSRLPVDDVAHFFVSNSKVIKQGLSAPVAFDKFIMSDGWYRQLFESTVAAMAADGRIAEDLFWLLVPLYLLNMCNRVSSEGRQQQHTADVWFERADRFIVSSGKV